MFRFFEYYGIQLARPFECESIFDKQTVPGAKRCRNCNYERNRQSQSVRASNDENSRCPDQGALCISCKPSVRKCRPTGRDRQVKKNSGGAVGQGLRTRSGSLGSGDQTHNA